jgi:NADPH2:quinone reductase
MTKTRAIRFEQTGGPEVLKEVEIDLPEPGPGQVLLRQTAVGLNYIDTYHRSGLYKVPLPSGLGQEAAGVIEAVGPGVNMAVGERVAYCTSPVGAYAERRVIAADLLVPLPASIGDREAAAMMLQGLTAWYLLHETYPVKKGDTILFHAAAGGVGLIACQWAKALGARVIGTVGSRAKAELARAHGCDEVIVTSEENFTERVRALTDGAGLPVVYDSIGKDTFVGSLDCLRPRGLMVSFGNSSGAVPAFEIGQLAVRGSLYLTRPTLFHYTSTRYDLLRAAASLFAAVATGLVKVEVRQTFKLSEAAEAHRALEGRRTTGSTVLIP